MAEVRRTFGESAIEAGRWVGREWPAAVHFSALGALAAAQGWLAWQFWGDFSDVPEKAATLRAVGLSLVAMEVVGLQMASRAAGRGEEAKARTWRAAWLGFALLNAAVDVSALSKLFHEGAQVQTEALAAYEAREARRAELDGKIERADDPFGTQWLGSVAAYDTAIAAKEAEIAARPHAGERWHGARARELGDLRTARAVAAQVQSWEAERSALREGEGAARPPEVGAEYKGLEAMLDHIPGVDVSPEQVRNGLAIGLALGMKLALTLAAWVGMSAQPKRREGTESESFAPVNTEPEPADNVLRAEPTRVAGRKSIRFKRLGRG